MGQYSKIAAFEGAEARDAAAANAELLAAAKLLLPCLDRRDPHHPNAGERNKAWNAAVDALAAAIAKAEGRTEPPTGATG